MLENHIKISASANSIEQLKKCLNTIIDRLENDDIALVYHDDFQFSYELFDNEILEIFDVSPKEFITCDLPNNL